MLKTRLEQITSTTIDVRCHPRDAFTRLGVARHFIVARQDYNDRQQQLQLGRTHFLDFFHLLGSKRKWLKRVVLRNALAIYHKHTKGKFYKCLLLGFLDLTTATSLVCLCDVVSRTQQGATEE
jgi:hypothetical protein